MWNVKINRMSKFSWDAILVNIEQICETKFVIMKRTPICSIFNFCTYMSIFQHYILIHCIFTSHSKISTQDRHAKHPVIAFLFAGFRIKRKLGMVELYHLNRYYESSYITWYYGWVINSSEYITRSLCWVHFSIASHAMPCQSSQSPACTWSNISKRLTQD